jgi:hypothetical protein
MAFNVKKYSQTSAEDPFRHAPEDVHCFDCEPDTMLVAIRLARVFKNTKGQGVGA